MLEKTSGRVRRGSKTKTRVRVVEDGRVRVRPDALIRGRHFELLQFHFHAASEHTIDGESFPLEGHFVFKAKDGRLAVVGVQDFSFMGGSMGSVVRESEGEGPAARH
mgnify:CR=1 FL=1